MSKEAMQMALDWFDWFQNGTNPNGAHVLQVEEALRTALAQPEPEPVAWLSIGAAKMIHWSSDKPAYGGEWIPLYTAPQQRKEWVGLTEHEIVDCFDLIPPKFARSIEAKLKEKNGF